MFDEWRIIPTTKLLRELAYHFTLEGKEIFSAEELHSRIEVYLKGKTLSSDFKSYTATDLIREISEVDGIFIIADQQKKYFTFLHRTFQEYLTASYLNQVIEDNKEKGMNLIKEHLWDLDWHEILILLAEFIDDPTLLIKTIQDEYDDIFKTQLILAGRCITECRLNFNPMIARIVKEILDYLVKYSLVGYIIPTIVALGHKYSEVFDMLADSFYYHNKEHTAQTVKILGTINTPQTINVLTRFIKDKDANVRFAATKALGIIGGNEANKALVDAFKDPDAIVRHEIARSLGNNRFNKAFKPLIDAIKDKDAYVRSSAALALWKVGKEKAVKPLIEALTDDDFKVSLRQLLL